MSAWSVASRLTKILLLQPGVSGSTPLERVCVGFRHDKAPAVAGFRSLLSTTRI